MEVFRIEKLKIREVDSGNAGILIRLCIPPDRWGDPLFKRGDEGKERVDN